MSTSPVLMTNSIGGVGDGPYGIREPEKIFTERSFPFNPETGSIGIPNFDGLKKIIPEDEMTPPGTFRASKSWSYHKYLPLLDFPDRYGKVKDVRDFCFKAQIVSYEQYRALQEGFNYKMWDWYTGMLVWKNQNPWTALRGFFYDYYLDYTGGYFGYMHGAAPVHIQLNLNDSVVCVLNQTARDKKNLDAEVRLYDLHGKLILSNKNTLDLNAHDTRLLEKVKLPEGGSEVFFLELLLLENKEVIDENIYWLTNKPKSYEKLNDLRKVDLKTDVIRTGGTDATVSVTNQENETAFFIRLKVVDKEGNLILPAYFSESYFTLLPGNSKEIKVALPAGKATENSNGIRLVVEGWNTGPAEIIF
jgi:hypothetical protein